MEKLLGSSTMILATLMVLIAIPSQVIKNFKSKSCEFSFLMVFLPLLVYISRSAYSFTIKSYFIFIPDIIGTILFLIIFWQYINYKKPN